MLCHSICKYYLFCGDTPTLQTTIQLYVYGPVINKGNMSCAGDYLHLQEDENLIGDKIFEMLLLEAKPTNANVAYSPWSIYKILSFLVEYSSSDAKPEVERMLRIKQTQCSVDEDYASIPNLVSTVKSICYSEEYLISTNQYAELKESLEGEIKEKLKIDVKFINILSEREGLSIENVLSFKAKWDCKFSNVYDGEFFISDHEAIETPMMKIVHHFNYKKDEYLNAGIVEIPFASKKISMVVIVPLEGRSVNELELKLCATKFDRIIENLSRTFIMLQLPKMTIKKELDVGDILQQVDITSIFSETKGGISNMMKEDKGSLFLIQILQRITLEIDDDGYPLPPPPKGPTGRCFCRAIRGTVNANRPFILYVKTNEPHPRLIFQCKIINPSSL